jgi:CubicO group peptidase (beta-lactamase class C family)
MIRLPIVILVAFVWASALVAAPPPDLDSRVEELRKKYGVPGMAVTVVETGQPSVARGYGVRSLEARAPVDSDTIFSTGSTGKAFTSAALAILVDEGKLAWDDRVIDHIPYFRMYDAWVTREMTVRDLLVHRSGLGLGAGDLLFLPKSSLSREESVRRLQHIKPATSFRSGYAYDNVLYMVAGQLVEEVSGQSWEEFTRTRIFQPAGMVSSTADSTSRMATDNRARPHGRLNGPIRGMGDQVPLDEAGADLGSNAAPAGGLAISANDMAKWLQLQLARGALPNGRLFSEAQSREMWQPVVLTPVSTYTPALKPIVPMFATYALGWTVQDYRGAKLVWHGGAVLGSLATVALLPERGVGIYIAANSEEPQVVRGLMYELLDHYLDLPATDWPEKLDAYLADRRDAGVKAIRAQTSSPAASRPSLPLARYAGRYADPWYGTITVSEERGKLRVAFPDRPSMVAQLDHHQYDTFRTVFADKGIEPAFVTFSLDADGKVDRITMKAISPIADFSWDYHDLLFTPVKEAPAR